MTTTTVTEAVINQVAEDIHTTALDKGFWDTLDPFLAEVNSKLLLIVSEVTEAMEVMRRPYDDSPINAYTHMSEMQGADFIEELTDIIIRTFDLARYLTVDVADPMLTKLQRNGKRPLMHNKRF